MPNTLSIEGLSLAAVEVVSKPFDWAAEGEGQAWNNVYAPGVMCPDCETVFPDGEATATCPHCSNAYLEERAGDPMMNYVWPLPAFGGEDGGAEIAQGTLMEARINICLVQVADIGPERDDEYGLALTGGGMNLAWDIAQAYVLLGYVPPVALYDSLPCFAGQDNSQEPFASVLKACHRGLESARNRLIWAEKKLLDCQTWTGQSL
jgi:hypothetical protein